MYSIYTPTIRVALSFNERIRVVYGWKLLKTSYDMHKREKSCSLCRYTVYICTESINLLRLPYVFVVCWIRCYMLHEAWICTSWQLINVILLEQESELARRLFTWRTHYVNFKFRIPVRVIEVFFFFRVSGWMGWGWDADQKSRITDGQLACSGSDL